MISSFNKLQHLTSVEQQTINDVEPCIVCFTDLLLAKLYKPLAKQLRSIQARILSVIDTDVFRQRGVFMGTNTVKRPSRDKHVGKLLATNRTCLYFRQLFRVGKLVFDV